MSKRMLGVAVALALGATGCGNVDDYVGRWEGDGSVHNAYGDPRGSAEVPVAEGRNGQIDVTVPVDTELSCTIPAQVGWGGAYFEKNDVCTFTKYNDKFIVDEGYFRIDGAKADLHLVGWHEYRDKSGLHRSSLKVDFTLRRTSKVP